MTPHLKDRKENVLCNGTQVTIGASTSATALCAGDQSRDFYSDEDLKVARKQGIEGFYYITHIMNLSSILEKGILSHSQVDKEQVSYTPIYDTGIVNMRQGKHLPNGKSLWEYANLYFKARNAMLYRVVHDKSANDIAVILIKPSILSRRNIFISNGNAASTASEFYAMPDGQSQIPNIAKEIKNDWWSQGDGSKRKMMAECLIPGYVHQSAIKGVYVGTPSALESAKSSVEKAGRTKEVEIVEDPALFFLPQWRHRISGNLSLVKGDMFFSRMQTLTISVNCVGVMGKGLASTAKYRFPDVYVRYEDRCKKKRLKMGRPYIHRRETSVFYDLSENTSGVGNDEQTWFLVFPTKGHWREKSDFAGIEKGMQWLLAHYEEEGVESLALPALGCGLGGLSWGKIGPMMCHYLAQMNIPTAVYLPLNKTIPEKQLTPEYLLHTHTESPSKQISIPGIVREAEKHREK